MALLETLRFEVHQMKPNELLELTAYPSLHYASLATGVLANSRSSTRC